MTKRKEVQTNISRRDCDAFRDPTSFAFHPEFDAGLRRAIRNSLLHLTIRWLHRLSTNIKGGWVCRILSKTCIRGYVCRIIVKRVIIGLLASEPSTWSPAIPRSAAESARPSSGALAGIDCRTLLIDGRPSSESVSIPSGFGD